MRVRPYASLPMFLAVVAIAFGVPLYAHAQTATNAAVHRTLPTFVAGADISLLAAEEAHGQKYYGPHGRQRPLLAILKRSGYNCVRLRLWVNPSGKGIFVNDLPYTIALGKRVKKDGFLLLLDMHLADSWADPGKQPTPAAWAGQPLTQLSSTLQTYTAGVIEAMRAGGAMPDIVEVGNEITGGILWPVGRIGKGAGAFTNVGALLKSAIAGIDRGSGSAAPPLVMIHIDRGGDWNGTKWFFDNLEAQHVPFDLIGESYYPMFHGPVAGLTETLNKAALRYNKPIVVVETGYAYKQMPGNRATSSDTKRFEFPFTPAGQSAFLAAVIKAVKQTPNGLGAGVVYWEPEWIPAPGLDGSWSGLTLFRDNGHALPGLTTLGRAGRMARSN